MTDEISELRSLWDAIDSDANEAKRKFRKKLQELSSKYTMTELAELTEIKRPTLYYHLGVSDGNSSAEYTTKN